MKKIFTMIIVLALMSCLVACGNRPEENEVNIENSEYDDVEIIRYFPSENFSKFAETQTITMPENPTTGYEWVYVLGDAEIVEIKRDEYVADSNEEGLVGVGGNRVIEVAGVTEGCTTITCEYMRNWEDKAEKIVTYYISVDEANNIAITDEVHENEES